MLEAAIADADVQAFGRLARILRIHARAEQEIVFPVLDGSYELGDHVREDVRAHQEIDDLIRMVERSDGATWKAHVVALRTVMLAHFADEEEILFPRAHFVISDQRSQDMLIEYQQLVAATP